MIIAITSLFLLIGSSYYSDIMTGISRSGAGQRAIISRPEVQYRDEQQESQLWEKHPFLPRPSNPYLSQSQTSLSQGFRTDSQSTQRFSQNSQPEDYVCDQVIVQRLLEKLWFCSFTAISNLLDWGVRFLYCQLQDTPPIECSSKFVIWKCV